MRTLIYSSFLCLISTILPAQEFITGITLSAGGSWEIERLPYTVRETLDTDVQGGFGKGISLLLGYRLNHTTISVRPGFLAQQLEASLVSGDDGAVSFKERFYHKTVLIPLRVDHTFGEQRFRPQLGLGVGFLINLGNARPEARLQAEPILPYLEVFVGVTCRLKSLRLTPGLIIRNSTGELFRAGGGMDNARFPGQRWGYAAFGITVSR